MAATSIHIEPVKTGSEQHNRREKELDYVIKSRTHLNEYWQSDTQEHRLAEIKKIVKQKTGRKLQKIATPLREGVVVIKPTTTMDDLQNFAAAIKKKWGIDCFQIAIHRDEGTQEGKINNHAHMVFDFMNHATGKSIKIGRTGASELQDMAAEYLGMERGVSSDIEHLNAIQYKNQAEEERLRRLKEEEERLKQENMKAEERKKEIEQKAVNGAKVSAANAIAAVGQAITTKLGLNKAQNELNELKGQLPKEVEKKAAEAKEKGKSEGYSAAINEVMKAAQLHFPKGQKPTTMAIGKAWREDFDNNKKFKQNFQVLLDRDKDKALYELAEKIVEGTKKGYFINDDAMITEEYTTKGGIKQTRVISKPYTRKDIRKMFDKLCESRLANNGTDLTAIKMHRQIVAGSLAIHCLYGLDANQMKTVDGMLQHFAEKYEPPTQRQERQQTRTIEREQTQRRKSTMHKGR